MNEQAQQLVQLAMVSEQRGLLWEQQVPTSDQRAHR